MSRKAASSLLPHFNYIQNFRSFSAYGAKQSPGTSFFKTDNNNKIHLKFRQYPGTSSFKTDNINKIQFRSGAWKEDFAGKKWGLLWTLNRDNNWPNITTSDIGYKQKMVKVMTKTGEMEMAVQFDTSTEWNEILRIIRRNMQQIYGQ